MTVISMTYSVMVRTVDFDSASSNSTKQETRIVMKVFIISDTHFGHTNIIKYENRPFSSTEEMDKTLIENWNSVVDKKDRVIHLGDFMLGKKERCKELLSQLNGDKVLIKGNHDNWSDQFYRDAGFSYVSKYPIVWNKFYVLSHAPLEMQQSLPFFNYYGHVHSNPMFQDTENSKCVCVERIDYTPMFLCEV